MATKQLTAFLSYDIPPQVAALKVDFLEDNYLVNVVLKIENQNNLKGFPQFIFRVSLVQCLFRHHSQKFVKVDCPAT